jgi:AraC-like DNA-binding protein
MLFLGIVQSLAGFVIFLFRKPKHSSNLILAFWLLIIALVLSGGLVEGGVVQYFKPGVFPLVFLFGPMLYFYIQSQIFDEFQFQKKHILHLVPFFGVVLHRIFSQPVNIEFIDTEAQNLNNAIYELLMFISIVVYWIAGIHLLLKHRKNLPNNFSYRSERLTLNWTWMVVFVNILIFMLMFLSPFLGSLMQNVDPIWLFHFNFALFGYLLTLFGLMQPVIFYREKPLRNLDAMNKSQTQKYQRSGLTNPEMEEIVEKIYSYFEQNKPYLNAEFDLQKMSVEINVSRQNLSRVINEKLNKNFYRLVNEFRVDEVIIKMNDSSFSHLSLLGLALESGFNSKASFNRVFKEITGKTPSEFKSNDA